MSTKNIAEIKRFVFRSPDKKPTTYLVSASGSRPHVEIKNLQPQAIPTTEVLPSSSPPLGHTIDRTDTPQAGVIPPRRVVVIRNTKNSQLNQGPVDLGDFGQPNSTKVLPVINNGLSILLINLGSFVLYIREYFRIQRFISFDDRLHQLNHQKEVIDIIKNYVKYVFGFCLFY